jgi:hypothetical protein
MDRLLYLFIILDALGEGKDSGDWSTSDLMLNLILREKSRINRHFALFPNLVEPYLRMLCFVTVTKLQTIQSSEFLKELHQKCLSEQRSINLRQPKMDSLMEIKDGTMRPITPDIVGEWVVLDYLCECPNNFNPESCKPFLDAAYQEDPNQYRSFLYRTIQDRIWFDERWAGVHELHDVLFEPNLHHISPDVKRYGTIYLRLCASKNQKSAKAHIKDLDGLSKASEFKTTMTHFMPMTQMLSSPRINEEQKALFGDYVKDFNLRYLQKKPTPT